MEPLPYFPIEVTQDEKFYYVRIHPKEKHLASSIEGRSWDGEIRKWVYPKSQHIFEQLTENLKRQSNIFEISPPVSSKENEEEIPDKELKEFGLKQLETLETKLETKLETILENIGSIGLSLNKQEQKIESLFKSTTSAEKSLDQIESKVKDEKYNSNFDIDKKFNDYIQNILIQSSINNQDPSLNLIIRKLNFLNPSDFVLQTHERLRKEIEKVVRAPEHDTSFPSLIRTAYQGNNGKGIYRSTRKGKGIDIYDALYLLNNLRNEIAHPRNNKRMIYGITYASMFVEIWEKIRQDD